MTAREWSSTVGEGEAVRWRALEVAAFDKYPRVLRQLDPKGKYAHGERRGGGSFVQGLLGIAAILAIVVFYFPSVAGFATLIGDRFNRSNPDPAVTIPVASVIFAFAFLMLLVTFIPWLKEGRPKETASEVQTLTAAALGGISIFVAGTRGAAAGIDNWQLWIIPIVLSTVFGTVYLVMLLVAHRQHTVRTSKATLRGEKPGSSGTTGKTRTVGPLKRVRVAVERLSSSDREAVRADITGAIDDLARRGIITAGDADWARGAELGKLALRMSQPHKRSDERPGARARITRDHADG